MKNFIFRFWLIGIALLMAGCGGGSSSSNDMAFTRVGANQYSYWPTGTYVIKTESDWNSAWDKNVTAYQPSQAQAKPAVDFASSMLVGVAHENISCAVFGITRVVEESSQVRVEYAYSYLPPQTTTVRSKTQQNQLVSDG